MSEPQRRGPQKTPLKVRVTGERGGREVTALLTVQRLTNPEADFHPGSDALEDFKADEDKRAYRPLYWRRVGEPTWSYDCAGLILHTFWSEGPYWVTAPELYENFLKPFGRRLTATEATGAGDILVFRAQGSVAHVALVLNSPPVRSLATLNIRTKDGEQSTFENTAPLFGPGASNPFLTSLGIDPRTIQSGELFTRYDAFEFWRVPSEVRQSLRFVSDEASGLDGALTVRVEDESGSPLSGAQVMVSFPGKAEALRKGTTGAGGAVTFASVPGSTGKRLIRALKSGYKSGEATVELALGQSANCTIRLTKVKPPPRPDSHGHLPPPKKELVVLSVTATPERVGRGQRVEIELVYEARGLPSKPPPTVTADETVTLQLPAGAPMLFPTKSRPLVGSPPRGRKVFEGRFTKPGTYRWSCQLWALGLERTRAEVTFRVS